MGSPAERSGKGENGSVPEPNAADLLNDLGLELLIIGKCAPLVDNSQSASAIYDVTNDRMKVSVNVSETLGMTLPQAVDQLGIRPLAFGSAWKCLDVLVEYAPEAAGGRSRRRSPTRTCYEARQSH